MNEILVALIGTAGLIAVAILANRTRQHAKAAREQLENDHPKNLRVEGDERYLETIRHLEGIASDVRGLRRDIGRHTDHLTDHEKRLDDLERTQPAPPKKRRQS